MLIIKHGEMACVLTWDGMILTMGMGMGISRAVVTVEVDVYSTNLFFATDLMEGPVLYNQKISWTNEENCFAWKFYLATTLHNMVEGTEN